MNIVAKPLTLRDVQEADASYLRFVIKNGEADATTHDMIEKELIRRETRRSIN